MLLWGYHPIFPDHYITRLNGCSIVYGPLLRYYHPYKYEVQDQEGEIHRFVTAKEAEEFCEKQPCKI